MNRKWMGALAALLVVGAFVFAKSLADKRPRLVARDVDASDLVISPEGKRLVANANGANSSHVIDLENGLQFSISNVSYPRSSFSPDGKKIYQLNTEWENPNSQKIYDVLVLWDAYSGRKEGQFRFASGDNIYGAWWSGNEIIVESAQRTWHFEARTLRLKTVQKQYRKATYAVLCPDGQTFYWNGEAEAKGEKPGFTEFADLRTGKMLWIWSQPDCDTLLGFSVDGGTVFGMSGLENQHEIVARETRTGKEKWRFRGPQYTVMALAPDESAIYEARPNGELWKWPR